MQQDLQSAAVEEQVLTTWREMLGTPDASLDDTFFESGGTSLIAARLATRLTAVLGCRVAAADILAHPSARRLAQKLGGQDRGLDRAESTQRASQQRQAFAMSRPSRIPR